MDRSSVYIATVPACDEQNYVAPGTTGDHMIMSRSKRVFATALTLATLTIALSGCGDPYDPGARAGSGALIGAGGGAAIGALAGGGRGAAIGALTGGAVGAAGGAATTPNRRGY
jgi:hypothetical protein